ncbi:MAG TPA: DUF892 family protein [Candidatus Thermoplasmatota archaeon]|nr:DUF892 family protein [Candidatus Thermoplasmatota archaeon]
MTMETLHDLFEHELKDIYDAESRLVDALRQQASESTDAQIRAAFQAHMKETEGQKERLEQVFEIWGKEATRGEGCAGVQGLLEEHKNFKREKPAGPILDVFNLGAAAKVERYEITAYEGLIRLATQMGLDDAVELLEQNLEEEEATLEKVTGFLDDEKVVAKMKTGEKVGSKGPTRSR